MPVRPVTLIALLGVCLVAAPTPASAQRPYAWVMPVQEPESSLEHPFSVLLDRRVELALDDSQVERIESVRERLVETNEPLLAQIRDSEVYEPEREEELQALETVRERRRRRFD